MHKEPDFKKKVSVSGKTFITAAGSFTKAVAESLQQNKDVDVLTIDFDGEQMNMEATNACMIHWDNLEGMLVEEDGVIVQGPDGPEPRLSVRYELSVQSLIAGICAFSRTIIQGLIENNDEVPFRSIELGGEQFIGEMQSWAAMMWEEFIEVMTRGDEAMATGVPLTEELFEDNDDFAEALTAKLKSMGIDLEELVKGKDDE